MICLSAFASVNINYKFMQNELKNVNDFNDKEITKDNDVHLKESHLRLFFQRDGKMYLYSGGFLGSKNMGLYRALGKKTEFMGMALLSSGKYSTLVKMSANFMIFTFHGNE